MSHAPILLVTELYPPSIGGSAVLFENVYTRLPGSAVRVLTDERVAGARPSGRVGSVAHAPLHTPHWGLASPRGTWHHLATARRVRREARALGRATVVHCGRVLPEGVAAWIASFAGGPPYTCWLHGEDLATAGSSRELSAVTRQVLAGAAHVFANSRNTRDVAARFGVDASRVTVIHPGVDAARFRPEIRGDAVRMRHRLDGCFVVLSVGRLQARKGHDVALRAVAALAAAIPDLRYVIVGDGEERARLEALAGTLGVADRVVFAGEVADPDLPAYFAACDVFLLANRVERGDFEGFGIVFLEAAAAGRPAVGGRSGGVVEAVADGETGLLVDAADAAAVAEALGSLHRDVDLRARLGRAGAERARREFSWERAAAALQEAHDRLSAP